MVEARYRHCFESATAAAGRQLDEDELNSLFGRVQGRINRYVSEGATPRDAAMRAGTELANEHRAAAVRAGQTAAMNLQKRVAMRTWLTERAENEFARNGKADPVAAVQASLDGTASWRGRPHAPGASDSTAARAKSIQNDYIGAIDAELRKAGLSKAARGGVLDRDIAREMYELSQQADGQPAQVGRTGSKPAQDIATIYHKYLALTRENLNKQGAWIGNLSDYIMRNSWDAVRIYSSKPGEFERIMLPLLNQARTFENAEPGTETQFLTNVRNALATGTHFSDAGGVGFKAPSFSGPGNLAKRLSESRVLHFKDADSWFDAMQQFGQRGTLAEKMAASLRRAGDQEGLLSKWGTNPEAEFKNTLRWMREKYVDKDQDAAIALKQNEKFLQSIFDVISGTSKIPDRMLAAQWAQGARNLAVASKLGNVPFAHLSSVVTAARELQRHGTGFLESYRNSLMSFLGPWQGEDARALHDVLHASVEAAHVAMNAPTWIDDSLPGTTSRIANKFMQFTGLPFMVDWKKTMVAGGIARLYGQQLGKTFDELHPANRQQFLDHNITAEDWDALRNAPDHFKNSLGNELLLPDAAHRAGLSDDKARDLALRLNALYSSAGDRATITPGATTRAFFQQGTHPGSLLGELTRFVAQFKTWPVAMWQQSAGAERGTAAIGGALAGIVQIAAGMTLFGYLRDTLSDLFQGKQPRPPGDLRTLAHAVASGGSAGIFGDYLFGQTNRFGQGIGESILGPVLGEGLNDFATVWNNMKDDALGGPSKARTIAAELFRMARNNAPFVNLFYTRAAFNYLFMASLQEAMSPGYLRRSRESLKKQTGQGYISPATPGFGWMNPESHLHTFGR